VAYVSAHPAESVQPLTGAIVHFLVLRSRSVVTQPQIKSCQKGPCSGTTASPVRALAAILSDQRSQRFFVKENHPLRLSLVLLCLYGLGLWSSMYVPSSDWFQSFDLRQPRLVIFGQRRNTDEVQVHAILSVEFAPLPASSIRGIRDIGCYRYNIYIRCRFR